MVVDAEAGSSARIGRQDLAGVSSGIWTLMGWDRRERRHTTNLAPRAAHPSARPSLAHNSSPNSSPPKRQAPMSRRSSSTCASEGAVRSSDQPADAQRDGGG